MKMILKYPVGLRVVDFDGEHGFIESWQPNPPVKPYCVRLDSGSAYRYYEDEIKPEITDCKSEDGVTIGLIDSIMSIAAVLNTRDLNSRDVQEALKDLRSDQDLRSLIIGSQNPDNSISRLT